MAVIQVTDSSFATDVLGQSDVVLVDFWAEWCGPCRMIDPVLKEIAGLDSTIIIAKVNIDENPNTPATYGVRSIPTLMLFKGGEVVDTKVGVQSKSTLQNWITSHR